MDSSSVVTLATAIRTQEGWFPGSVSYRNNNPGNLKYAGQPGAFSGAGGFAVFPSADAGFQALQNQISLDAGRGLTLSQFVSKYAPASENDTVSYLNSITSQTGFAADQPLSSLSAVSSYGGGSDTYSASDDPTEVSLVPAGVIIGVLAAGLAYVVLFR